jgi:hypothetical protein
MPKLTVSVFFLKKLLVKTLELTVSAFFLILLVKTPELKVSAFFF